MRTRYIQDDKTGKLIPYEEYYGEPVAPLVMPDIQPYKNMLDGKVINSRSEHRAFIRRNNLIEYGNEVNHLTQPRGIPDVDPKGRKEMIVAQVQALGGHDNFRRAVQRDVDFIRWNSRGLPQGEKT